MQLNKNIFRAYDIRGIVGEDLTPEVSEQIGYAFGTYLTELNPGKSLHIVVGHDNRPSGPELSSAFQRGLVASGVEAFDLGESPSPFLYYAVAEGGYDGGVNITASHNPPEYNGIKMVSENANPVHGSEIQRIYEIASTAEFEHTDRVGAPLDSELREKYIAELSSKIKLEKPLKVVVDSAGGVATGFYSSVLFAAGVDAIELYPEADGTFPYHSPDPLVEENSAELKKKVIAEGADIGLAFDGDGDRVLAVTEKGEFVDANKILVLLAQKIIQSGDTVVHTVSASSIVPEEIKKLGGVPVMVPVGHSFVHSKMHETGAPLGGEQSGHFFVAKDYHEFDDALYSALNLLSVIASGDKPFSEMVAEIPNRYSPPERRLTCSDDKKFEIVQSITDKFKENFSVETMDGVRVDFGNGAWAGIRASNTSPKISVITEAASEEDLERVNIEVETVLKQFPDIQL